MIYIFNYLSNPDVGKNRDGHLVDRVGWSSPMARPWTFGVSVLMDSVGDAVRMCLVAYIQPN